MFQACGWSNMFQCQMKQIPSVVYLGNIEKCFRISGNVSEQLFCRLSLIDCFWIHNIPKLYWCFNKLFAISCKLLNQTSILTAVFLIANSQFDLCFTELTDMTIHFYEAFELGVYYLNDLLIQLLEIWKVHLWITEKTI